MKIGIIVHTLPPRLDGIGDYTANLAARLCAAGHAVRLYVGDAGAGPLPGVEVERCFDAGDRGSVRALPAALARFEPDWILLQYCPFSYGRWGLNLSLPGALERARRVCPGSRLAVMVHEPMAWAINWKLALMTMWHRWQLRQLGRTSALVLFSIQPWADQYRSWFPGARVEHLPVSSNVPNIGRSRADSRRALGLVDTDVVLGVFGQGHHSYRLAWVASSARRIEADGLQPVVLQIGPAAEQARAALGGIRCMPQGRLSPYEVSERFAAMDLYLAPFVDGVSTRRTSFMTALQHGVPVVGTRGEWTDGILAAADGRSLVLAAADDELGFNTAAASLAADLPKAAVIGRRGQDLFDEAFAWDRIAARLLDALARVP